MIVSPVVFAPGRERDATDSRSNNVVADRHDRDRPRCLLCNFRSEITKSGKNINLHADQFCGKLRQLLQTTSRIAQFD